MKMMMRVMLAAVACAALAGCATTGEERGQVLATGKGIVSAAGPALKGAAKLSGDPRAVAAVGWWDKISGWFGGGDKSVAAPVYPGGVETADFEELPDGSFVPYLPPTNKVVTWTFPKPFISGVKSEPAGAFGAPQVMPPGWSSALVPPVGAKSILPGETTGRVIQ